MIASFTAMFTATIAMVAPAALNGDIQSQLHASGSQLSWVTAIFFIPTAALELTFGVVGDLLGRKRLLVAGSVVLAIGVGIGGLAGSVPVLLVAQAVAGDPATPWYTDWYGSPDFADLRPGTGLLLDMGRTVTVTSVRVSLGGEPGASLQLRAGLLPTLAWLPVVAGVSDAGGTVRLQPSPPVHVRYILIWFTDLPPTPAGTYQASIYQVVIQGQP